MSSIALLLSLTLCAQAAQPVPYALSRNGTPNCTLIASPKTELQRRSARAVVDGARDVGGVALPSKTAELPPSVYWILVENPAKDISESDTIQQAITMIKRETPPTAGFAVYRLEGAVALLAADDSAAYYGSLYCRDALLKLQGGDAVMDEFPAMKSPFAVRGMYHLTCWGRSPEYRMKDWKVVFDSMAEDGINADYFWMCGLFRSKKCPQAFTYPSTAPTTEEIRQLIDYAHTIGVDFYLGSGVFAWFGLDALAEAHPETKAVGSTGGMCPSNPLARKLNLEYLTEMYDAFPEADGMFLEIRDEYGDCKCERCMTPLPEGGTQYARSELSFLADLRDAVWEKHPRAKFVWCIGYSGNVHAADKAYYEQLTRTFSDPRFQWLEVRNNWTLPAADGRRRPLTWFSPNMISWSKPYCQTTDDVRRWLQKSERERTLGAAAAFEPGFHSASYYSGEVPFPVDAIPYAISRFAYRTYSWEPDLSPTVFRQRLHRKYFTAEIAPEMVDDILWLYDFIRASSCVAANGTERGLVARNLSALEKTDFAALLPAKKTEHAGWLRKVTALSETAAPRLKAIDARLAAQRPASARSKLGLAMIRRAVDDIRAEMLLTPEGQTRLRAVAGRQKPIND